MSDKRANCCVCLLIIFGVLMVFVYERDVFSPSSFQRQTTVTFLDLEVQCEFDDTPQYTPRKIPTMESFIPTSTTQEGQELRLSGLVVFSLLANACQPLADVSKAKIQINKIALISLANETGCPSKKTECSLKDLLIHAQNAGYLVVIITLYSYVTLFLNTNETELQDKLLIPVLAFHDCQNPTGQPDNKIYSDPSAADRTKIEIRVKINQKSTILNQMKKYLKNLYVWFLFGPVITLEWLRRRKKLCCMSGSEQAEGGRLPEETTVESALNTAADHLETQRNYNQETEYEETRSETQPLLIVLNDPFTNSVTRSRHTRLAAIRRVSTYLGKMFGYVILVVVALPVGISSGGWSFFRFDENEIPQPESFLAPYDPYAILSKVLSLGWSPIKIFCFFVYSRFACKTTWTVQTNFSKLIRSDWFSSNVYLLIFGVVVPFCSTGDIFFLDSFFDYFASYNMICTICNVLFVLILNKHKFVTRYVFYISVCMICAYIESDIVAVFYFMMNSTGSLINLKLTALRTVAIGLTLTLSFSSSMHIIRKLTKPQESLLEGVGEK